MQVRHLGVDRELLVRHLGVDRELLVRHLGAVGKASWC